MKTYTLNKKTYTERDLDEILYEELNALNYMDLSDMADEDLEELNDFLSNYEAVEDSYTGYEDFKSIVKYTVGDIFTNALDIEVDDRDFNWRFEFLDYCEFEADVYENIWVEDEEEEDGGYNDSKYNSTHPASVVVIKDLETNKVWCLGDYYAGSCTVDQWQRVGFNYFSDAVRYNIYDCVWSMFESEIDINEIDVH